MDFELLQTVVAELKEKIVGARIAKIHQPAADLFIFRLWTGKQNLKLLISTSAQESRIHLTEKSFPNPFTPPRFCQLLRARLSRITAVDLLNEDRIVEIACQGPKGDCRLIVELTGKSSNLLLVDTDERIIDALRRIKEGGARSIVAGEKYLLPSRFAGLSKITPRAANAAPPDIGGSEAVEKLYSGGQAAESTTELGARLERLVHKEQKKLSKRLKNIEQELQRQQGFEGYRQLGDLLLANMHLLKRGLQEVTLENYYLQPPAAVTISLNPVLNPQENAEKYYQKHKKAKRGLEHSARRKQEAETELEWLAQLDYQLNVTREPAEISIVAEELRQAGILKEAINKLPRVAKDKRGSYLSRLSPNGFKILWGSNSRQNDALSTQLLKKGDLWFHAHRCPGSHVVLKSGGGVPFEEADILCAASIAAAQSKAKNDHKVEVVVAAAKNVKKPTGAKSGMVTVKEYKTLMVEPFSD